MRIIVTHAVLEASPELRNLGIVAGQEIEVSLVHEDPNPSPSDPETSGRSGDPIEVPKKPPPVPAIPPQE